MKKCAIIMICTVLAICNLVPLAYAASNNDMQEPVGQLYGYAIDASLIEATALEFSLITYTKSVIKQQWDNENVLSAFIKDVSHEEQIEILDISASNPMSFSESKDIYYVCNVSYKIPASSFQNYTNASIIINYKDGSQIQLRSGDIAFSQSKTVYLENSALDYALIADSSLYKDEHDLLRISGIMLQLSCNQKITIEKLFLGLPGLGIDNSGIQVLNSQQYQGKWMSLLQEMSLDMLISNVYERKYREPSFSCNIQLDKGEWFLYIPFTFSDQKMPEPKRLFLDIIYEENNQSATFHVDSFPLYSIFRHSEQAIQYILTANLE